MYCCCASGVTGTETTSALTSWGTASASEGHKAAALATSDKIVEVKTLEKVTAWQDINEIRLLVGWNYDK